MESLESANPIDKTLRCIRCGFCLDACPTFRITGNEADSPRGRIYLVKSVSEGVLPVQDGVLAHLDACLGCRACETACPSGVEYGLILEGFRAEMESSGSRPSAQSFARRQLLSTLTSPSRLVASLKAARLLQVLGASREVPAFAAELLTGHPGAHITMPATGTRFSVGRLPERTPAIGKRRLTVAILAGCVMRVLYHDTNLATVRVLSRAGCDVLAPAAAGCCGGLHLHAGYKEDARNKARALIDALSGLAIDAFIINSAGCGSTIKGYGELLHDDPVYADRAAELSARTRDVCEFLDDVGLPDSRGRFDAVVAYHDACHLAHGQRITAAPRRLLAAVPGLQLVEIPESDTCCGSAGIYNMTEPAMARTLLERKVEFIARSGATVLATGNPGCLAWIQQGLQERGLSIAARHPIEIIDAAYEIR